MLLENVMKNENKMAQGDGVNDGIGQLPPEMQ